MFKSTNPVLSRMDNKELLLDSKPMTVSGTIAKVFVLLLIALISGCAVFYQTILGGFSDKVMIILTVALIGGLIAGLASAIFPKMAKYLAPIYAFAEGALLAGLSLFLETQFPGIAVQAVAGTFVAFLVMLTLYKAKIIKATAKFRSTIMTALITIMILYLISLVGSFFDFSIPFITGTGPMSIVFSGIVVTIASLCLILDFDFIEEGQKNQLPKDYEWYGAFGLMVTLVWLYIEILNLLAKLRDN